MRIQFLNGLGTGPAGRVDVAEGTVLAQFLRDQVGRDMEDLSITINGLIGAGDEILQDGDRVAATIAASKVKVE